MSTPCGWSVTGCACGSSCWGSVKPTVQAYAESVATMILWAATGRRYGQCELTVEPCFRPDGDPLYQTFPAAADSPTGQTLTAGWNSPCGHGSCSCTGRCEVPLAGPTSTATITSVTVAGLAVPASAWTVYDGYLLTRVDGQCWPTCRDYSDPDTAFAVTYLRGDPIPAHVQHAVNRLACELAKACVGADCALPANVRSLSRQGIEIQMADLPAQNGRIRTGVDTVDKIIDAENPHGLMQRPVVLSPDMPAPRMVT